MEIETSTSVPIAAAALALSAEYVHRAYEVAGSTASPANVALEEQKAIAVETTEQRAADGDPLAIDQLTKEHTAMTPIDARALQPPFVDHPPGAHEPGKGERIDIYD